MPDVWECYCVDSLSLMRSLYNVIYAWCMRSGYNIVYAWSMRSLYYVDSLCMI